MTLKHSTASVFVLGMPEQQWRLGLVWHPRFQRWMLPGGHVEEDENPAQAAVREVREETGLDVDLLATPTLPGDVPGMIPRPLWLVEQEVPPEDRLPHRHVHVDHLFVAVAHHPEVRREAEHPFGWYAAAALAELTMFDGSRRLAAAVLDNLDVLLPASMGV